MMIFRLINVDFGQNEHSDKFDELIGQIHPIVPERYVPNDAVKFLHFGHLTMLVPPDFPSVQFQDDAISRPVPGESVKVPTILGNTFTFRRLPDQERFTG
jgi:hypothetical protein